MDQEGNALPDTCLVVDTGSMDSNQARNRRACSPLVAAKVARDCSYSHQGLNFRMHGLHNSANREVWSRHTDRETVDSDHIENSRVRALKRCQTSLKALATVDIADPFISQAGLLNFVTPVEENGGSFVNATWYRWFWTALLFSSLIELGVRVDSTSYEPHLFIFEISLLTCYTFDFLARLCVYGAKSFHRIRTYIDAALLACSAIATFSQSARLVPLALIRCFFITPIKVSSAVHAPVKPLLSVSLIFFLILLPLAFLTSASLGSSPAWDLVKPRNSTPFEYISIRYYFESIPACLFTLFEIALGEGWSHIARTTSRKFPVLWVFWFSLLFLGLALTSLLKAIIVVKAGERHRAQEKVEACKLRLKRRMAGLDLQDAIEKRLGGEELDERSFKDEVIDGMGDRLDTLGVSLDEADKIFRVLEGREGALDGLAKRIDATHRPFRSVRISDFVRRVQAKPREGDARRLLLRAKALSKRADHLLKALESSRKHADRFHTLFKERLVANLSSQ